MIPRQHGKRSSVNRILEALGDRTMTWLSDQTGIRQSTLSEYNKGAAPRVDKALLIADALDVDVEWLFADQVERRRKDEATGAVGDHKLGFSGFPSQTAPPAASVMLPEIDIGYAMGGGLVIADHVDGNMVPFPRDWLRSLIRGTFDDVFIARGEGDSMQPTLLDGDIVIIDKSQDALTGQDRIWCVSYGDLGMIKRLRAQPDRGILVLSDNPAIAPFTAYDGELHIIGRVVWIGRKA